MNYTVLGINIGHDVGTTLIKDGKVCVGISEERLSRIKNHFSADVPTLSIKYCLDYANIKLKDVDLIIYTMLDDIGWTANQLSDLAGEDISHKIKFFPHHLAHAFSTFCASGFEEAAVIVADGGGSLWANEGPASIMKEFYPDLGPMDNMKEAYSIYSFSQNGVSEVFKKWCEYKVNEELPDSIISVGIKYGQGSIQLIYDENKNNWPAGKLMGLASYADTEFVKQHKRSYIATEDDLIIKGGRMYPEVSFRSDFQSKANVAGTYQAEQEEVSLHLAKLAKKLTTNKNLCVAGGSFLNCNSNELLLKSGLFEKYYFIPCADDSGASLGCAYLGASILSNNYKISDSILSPYLGRPYTKDEIEETLSKEENLKYAYYENFEDLSKEVASLLSMNKVIGWFQGGSETGPRALGNRSILANPSCHWMPNYINAEIKGREWYRPFAPAVLYDYQQYIFDLKEFSPYMLITCLVDKEWRNRLPAVTHTDNTSRIQSVSRESNKKFYTLIEDFYKITNVPVILNTSFNGPGEPIVETPKNAIDTFLNRKFYALVIENFLIFNTSGGILPRRIYL